MIREYPGGALVGVIDGLGHGPEAAAVARLCASRLSEYAGEPLDAVVAGCHAALKETRGVALSLCALDTRASVWSWLGVGNVSGVLLHGGSGPRRERTYLLQRNGIVGSAIPKLTVSTVPAAIGDVMILATDGIREEFADDLRLAGAPQQIARRILAGYMTGKDDALALVARYTG